MEGTGGYGLTEARCTSSGVSLLSDGSSTSREDDSVSAIFGGFGNLSREELSLFPEGNTTPLRGLLGPVREDMRGGIQRPMSTMGGPHAASGIIVLFSVGPLFGLWLASHPPSGHWSECLDKIGEENKAWRVVDGGAGDDGFGALDLVFKGPTQLDMAVRP